MIGQLSTPNDLHPIGEDTVTNKADYKSVVGGALGYSSAQTTDTT